MKLLNLRTLSTHSVFLCNTAAKILLKLCIIFIQRDADQTNYCSDTDAQSNKTVAQRIGSAEAILTSSVNRQMLF